MLIARMQAFYYHPKRTIPRWHCPMGHSTKNIRILANYDIAGERDIRKGGHLAMKILSGYQKGTESHSELFVILTE